MGFRDDFAWGTATAAFQIEGATGEDGKGLSVWDVFTKEDGRIFEGHRADTACDHYHRLEEDVALMAALGMKAYRFSISWPRILPEGIGPVNQKGIDFYNKLINLLIANNIQPYLTLFHWDYPYHLEKKGGWLNSDSPLWFSEYASVAASAFGDRVKHFITFNEPQSFVGHGYKAGVFAPGRRNPDRELVLMTHHILLAHGLAVKAVKKHFPDIRTGYAPTGNAAIPATDSPGDIEAARTAYFEISPDDWLMSIPLWSDPVVLGRYPEEHRAFDLLKPHLPKGWRKDLEIIAQPLDFYGQNLYLANRYKEDRSGYIKLQDPPGMPMTAAGWTINPELMYWAPRFLSDRYKLPVLIAENGISCHDAVSLDGKVHDPNRIDFLHRYLLELRRAAEDGVDILGYFYWSLMDNFEWASGYKPRFGLIHVDFETLVRKPKDSYYWYREVIASNGNSI